MLLFKNVPPIKNTGLIGVSPSEHHTSDFNSGFSLSLYIYTCICAYMCVLYVFCMNAELHMTI